MADEKADVKMGEPAEAAAVRGEEEEEVELFSADALSTPSSSMARLAVSLP
jgi:hypothetical protein